MSAKIVQASRAEISNLISFYGDDGLAPNDRKALAGCVNASAEVWIGFASGEAVCIFGLMPPTLADNRAYLWLHTTPAMIGHEFTFVRQSQIAVRKMLEKYPTVVGHCEATAEASQRWLRWLGAVFSPAEGRFIPFRITQ